MAEMESISFLHDPEFVFRTRLLLSIQVALLGAVTHQVRRVEVTWDAEAIHVHVWTDGDPDEDTQDCFGAVDAELTADFDPQKQVHVHLTRCDFPEEIPTQIAKKIARVFSRYEQYAWK